MMANISRFKHTALKDRRYFFQIIAYPKVFEIIPVQKKSLPEQR